MLFSPRQESRGTAGGVGQVGAGTLPDAISSGHVGGRGDFQAVRRRCFGDARECGIKLLHGARMSLCRSVLKTTAISSLLEFACKLEFACMDKSKN